MMQHQDARAGFSLLEILVALVLIGLLVGTLAPSVINQLTKGDVSRVVEDLDAVGDAAKMFKVDVRRWPGKLEDLVTRPSSTDQDLDGQTYPSGLLNKWAGPYLELAEITGSQLGTADGGLIQSDFEIAQLNSLDYLVVTVEGLSQETIDGVDLAVDGEVGPAAGRVQVDDTTPTAPILEYYAAQAQ